METLYRKKENGRYEKATIEFGERLSDGIWLVQNGKHSRSMSSLVWKVGDLKRVTDVVTHSALYSFEQDLTEYLMNLSKEGSEELKDAENLLGGYLRGAVEFYNISASDLCHLFLRRIAINIETK